MSKPQKQKTPRPLDELLDDQRRRWGRGERVLVETFLQQEVALAADRGAVLDLIYNEIVLRQNGGERPLHEEYVERFPLLSAELALQFEVERVLDWHLVAEADDAPPQTREKKPDLAALAEQLGTTPQALRKMLARARDSAARDVDQDK